MITVYTRPECSSCVWTKKFLAAKGIPYTEIDISVNEEAARGLWDDGWTELPVVITDHDHWWGYRHDKLKDLADTYEGQHHA